MFFCSLASTGTEDRRLQGACTQPGKPTRTSSEAANTRDGTYSFSETGQKHREDNLA